MKMLFGATFFFLSFVLSHTVEGQCNLTDWQALQSLYVAANGSNWTNNTGWEQVDPALTQDSPPEGCDLGALYGVTLGGDNNRVLAIDLMGNNLSGTLPDGLSALTDLQELNLSGNQLTAGIPAAYAELTNLIELNLSNNDLSGCYPAALATSVGNGAEELQTGGTIYSRPSASILVVPDFDPTKDQVDLGGESVHTQIMIDGPTGLTFENMFRSDSKIILEGIFLKDLKWFNFQPIQDAHFQQDISAALAYENCTGLSRPNTVYVRSHEPGLEEIVPFNLTTDKISFFYLAVRADEGVNFLVEQTPTGARFFSPYTGQSLTLAGISFGDLTLSHFEFRANQLEDNIAGRMNLDEQIANWQVDQSNVFNGKSVAMAGGVDRAPYHEFNYDEYTGDPICALTNSIFCNFSDNDISAGNNFSQSWEDFCAGGAGECQGPVVDLITPTSGGTFEVNDVVNISATVFDADGSLVSVDLTINGISTDFPNIDGVDAYEASWTPTAAGTYLISVAATDNDGLTSTDSRSVIVTDPDAGPNTPPVASFVATPESGTAPLEVFFDGSASTDADGDPLLYTWRMGHGHTHAGVTTYRTFSTPGTYNVTLIVDDGRGGIDSISAPITVYDDSPRPPVAIISSSTTSGGAPLNVSFDGSGSSDPNGDALTYQWDFGNGHTAEGVMASQSYPEEGVYLVTLTVDDGNGGTATATTTVNVIVNSCSLVLNYRNTDSNAGDNHARPNFSIDNNGTESIALQDITVRYWFTREGTADQIAWIDWAQVGNANVTTNFGQLANPVAGADHYLEYGFTAGAGLISPGGNSGPVQSRFAKADWSNYDETDDHSYHPDFTDYAPWENMTVYCNGILTWGVEPDGTTNGDDETNNPPVAVATATPVSGTAPLEVHFDADGSTDADGDVLTFNWNFGDGTTGSGSHLMHVYTSAGTYTATLTVSDGNGGTDTENLVITVDPATDDDGDVEVIVTVNSSWNNGYCASVEIVNNGGSAINGWTLNFDHLGTINNIWNVNWSNVGGNAYTASNLSWNANISTGGSRSFGYCASYSGTLSGPTNGVLNGASVPITLLNGTAPPALTSGGESALTEEHQLLIQPTVVVDHTTIRYQLPADGQMRLLLIDQAGRLVRTLKATSLPKGAHSLELPTSDLPQGMYFVRLVTKETNVTRRMVVAR